MSGEQLGIPFERGVPGSAKGADKIRPYVKTARYRVWDYIRRNPGCCDQEIRDGLDMSPNTVRPRRVELERAGLIRPRGLTKTKDKNADATAWESTGDPWPIPWPNIGFTFAKARSIRPTPAEFTEALGDIVRARDALTKTGQPFSLGTEKVFRWLSGLVG